MLRKLSHSLREVRSSGAACSPFQLLRHFSSLSGEGDFSYVGRQPGKVHYYEAFNQHLKDLNKYVEKEDRAGERMPGRYKILKEDRLNEMQVVVKTEKEISVSRLKLSLIARLIRGLTVREAVAQLMFSKKKHAKTALQLLSDACRDAQEKFRFIPDELELEHIFANRGPQQKRLRIMGRGRSGVGYRRSSHLTVYLRAIDFDKKIRGSKNEREAKGWIKKKLEVQAKKGI